ncbi:MAG: hypothetical protein ACOC42_01575 [Halobacteriota archaeon]
MEIDRERVRRTRRWVADRDEVIVPLINRVRSDLASAFDVEVAAVERSDYRDEVDAVFEEVDLAVNVTCLVELLRRIDIADDYPGFIVDELLGRELAGSIAGEQPLRLLGEATFHFADVAVQPTDETTAGLDDLDAALAAGFQTRLPGWPWRARPGPFGSPRENP